MPLSEPIMLANLERVQAESDFQNQWNAIVDLKKDLNEGGFEVEHFYDLGDSFNIKLNYFIDLPTSSKLEIQQEINDSHYNLLVQFTDVPLKKVIHFPGAINFNETHLQHSKKNKYINIQSGKIFAFSKKLSMDSLPLWPVSKPLGIENSMFTMDEIIESHKTKSGLGFGSNADRDLRQTLLTLYDFSIKQVMNKSSEWLMSISSLEYGVIIIGKSLRVLPSQEPVIEAWYYILDNKDMGNKTTWLQLLFGSYPSRSNTRGNNDELKLLKGTLKKIKHF